MKKIERCTGFTERSIHFTVFTVYASAACYKNKIMSGSNGKVNPKGNATRAEASKMVVFLYDLLA